MPTPFRDFDDYWSPFIVGQGPAPSYATALDYVPLPDSLVKLIETTWKRDIRDARGNPVWP